jgi:hypothetical protein
MDLQKHIRKIISEDINGNDNDIYSKLYLKRRIPNFTEDNVLNKIYKIMSETNPNDYWDEYDWAGDIISWVINDLMVDVIDPKYDDIVDIIDDYMKMEYGPIMFEYYEDYFGKDDDLTESIKKIIEEEVSKKYPKPNEKLDKVVYKWLDNYFGGSQIYKNEYWKYYGFAFEFCKNGRDIADLRVRFDDKSPDWGPSDKRPTNERTVKEVMLYIYPIMVDELIVDIPIRKNYLLYLIEEWFEDTQLDKIQQGFDRNDLSLDYVLVFEGRKKGEICVPRITKPEDITMEEMKDYIKANTLFSYKDMEKHEEEEPGWIENVYLGKLHSKEKERVNQEDRENNPPY